MGQTYVSLFSTKKIFVLNRSHFRLNLLIRWSLGIEFERGENRYSHVVNPLQGRKGGRKRVYIDAHQIQLCSKMNLIKCLEIIENPFYLLFMLRKNSAQNEDFNSITNSDQLQRLKKKSESEMSKIGDSWDTQLQMENKENYELGKKKDDDESIIDIQKELKRSYKRIGQVLNDEKVLEETVNILEQYFNNINYISEKVLQNINDLIISRKIYKIRQNFRNLVLQLLHSTELVFYVSYESGRIEFQDFSQNFITEILETDPKCLTLQNISSSTTQDFNFVDICDNSDFAKIFQINPAKIDRNTYFGLCFNTAIYGDDETFNIFLMVKKNKKTEKDKLYEELQPKLISKIVEISMISTSQQSNLTIYKNYSKKMLDLFEILLINDKKKEQKRLCCYHSIQKQNFFGINLTNIIKIVLNKRISKQKNQRKNKLIQLAQQMVNKIEELQFNKIEEIRMYKKYVRDRGTIFLEFDQSGILCFISGNKDHYILNNISTLWEPEKPILEEAFEYNPKLLQKLKKALKSSVKCDRPFQVTQEVTAKIIQDSKKIKRIHIMVDDKDDSSQSNSIFESRGNLTKIVKKQKVKKGPNSASLTIKLIEKQNPGIVEEGWIDLFLKNNTTPQKNHRSNSKIRTFIKAPSSDPEIEEFSRSLSFSVEVENSILNMKGIQIHNEELNLLEFDPVELQEMVIEIFKPLKAFQSITEQKTKEKAFLNFLSDLHDQYEIHSNPFHNFTHGVNVMHTCFLLSTRPGHEHYLTDQEIFAIVFSGLCHDVGHTGYTNSFEIASQSRKALIYNDNSPLQNFHASTTFELLKKQKNNFLMDLERNQMKKFRKLVVSNILFTDIKEHFPLLKKFNETIPEYSKSEENHEVFANMIVHSSDFAGSIKNFNLCQEWSYRVNQQFTKQYKKQEELGLPLTPFMKDLENKAVLAKNEFGFLKVIVYPLFQALNKFYGEDTLLKKFKKNIETNIKEWEKIQKQES